MSEPEPNTLNIKIRIIKHPDGSIWVYFGEEGGEQARIGPCESLKQADGVAELVIRNYRQEYEPDGAIVRVTQVPIA